MSRPSGFQTHCAGCGARFSQPLHRRRNVCCEDCTQREDQER